MSQLSIEIFSLGPLETNAYLLRSEQSEKAVVIDPGLQPESLFERIEDMELEAILLTHTHFDHIGSVDRLRTWKKCPVYVHEREAEWLLDPDLNGSTRWPDVCEPLKTFPAEHMLKDGQTLNLLGLNFKVIHTPGHSPGSVSYLYENVLFSGDVIFKYSVGRTDLPGGSSRELYESIHDRIFQLPDDTILYPGHGPATTIGGEKKNNPYV